MGEHRRPACGLPRSFGGNFMANLPKNFLEFSQKLNEHKVRYLIVGGYAVIYHGYPRSTVDFDVFVAMDKQNAVRLSRAIADFGFDPEEYSSDFFLTPSSILMIGREPWRIDIFTSIKGLDFGAAYKKRVCFKIQGVKIPFVGRDDLLKSKEASGRDRDRDDLRRLGGKANHVATEEINQLAGSLGKGKRAASIGEMKTAARKAIAKAGAAGLNKRTQRNFERLRKDVAK
jgi:predicted nucleotidyltransferase